MGESCRAEGKSLPPSVREVVNLRRSFGGDDGGDGAIDSLGNAGAHFDRERESGVPATNGDAREGPCGANGRSGGRGARAGEVGAVPV